MAEQKKKDRANPEATSRIGGGDADPSETMDVSLDETGRLEAEALPEKTSPIQAADETASVATDQTSLVDTGEATGRIDTAGLGATDETGRIETGRADTREVTGRIETTGVDSGKRTGRIETAGMSGMEMTGRIETEDVSPDETADLSDDLAAAMAATMAVSLEEEPPKASETSRIETDELGKPGKETSRIAAGHMGSTMAVDLEDDAPGSGKVGKAETARIDAPDSESTPTRPRTVKLKRSPSVSAPTRVLKKAPAPSEEDAKSSTSKLELPEAAAGAGGRPVTRPKTIRIRRPDSTGSGQQITVARPAAGAPPPLISPAGVPAAAMAEAAAPGTGYAVMALFSVLVSLVLVYALLGQSFMPDLPFPGLR